jgi:hypothetical protein
MSETTESLQPGLQREAAETVSPSSPNSSNGLTGRRQDGRFAGGNSAARQLGLYARQQPAPLVAAAETLKAAVVADLGGAAELTALERAYLDKLCHVEVVLSLLATDIAQHGLLTPVGGVRRVHEAFLSACLTWDRLAQRLGTRRRQKRVPDLRDYLTAQRESTP